MRPNQFQTATTIFVYMLVFLGARHSLGEDPEQLNSLLIENWHHRESGNSLQIRSSGSFGILGAEGQEILSGEISTPGWESVKWTPGNYVDAIIIRIEIEGTEWVISGYYSYGEGDPSGLNLMAGGVFPEAFFGAFGFDRGSNQLSFQGSGP